ncbi:MAG: DNA internalization-related competence protein ComEC/Rec2 [Planctomycetes bacterium]|nr:DNA internalization-related competence protein ComEC/Rec2 [Planctomycetota bacterium]
MALDAASPVPGVPSIAGPGAAPRRENMTLLALCLAAGITIGWFQAQPMVWPWLMIAVLALLGAGLVHARSRPPSQRAALGLIAVTTVCFGAAWLTLRHHYVPQDDLAAMLGDQATLVRVRGEALGPPVIRDRSAGSMAQFDYRPPATYFPLRVDATVSRDGRGAPVRGKVLVRVEQVVAPFHAGDRVEATGWLHRLGAPMNPGEFDYQRYARSLGQAGVLSVEQRDLLTVMPGDRNSVHGDLLKWRDAFRRRAGGWLLSDLPETDRTKRDALLSALLLGRRGPELDGVGESFRRVGLAHLLAISGLHLGVLAGFVLLLARLGGHYQRWHGWLLIAVVLAYLVLVEVRMPVLRAGVMTIVASLGLAFGRRIRVSGLVALSAIVLLLWRPDQLFTAGFQLSYGVVLGLVHLQPVVRQRLFGVPDRLAPSSRKMVGQWLCSAVAVAVTAWLIATPMQMYYFGTISPLAVPITVIAVPIVAVLLAVGYVKMVLAVVLPSAALLLGLPLMICADVLIAIVDGIDAVPGSFVHVPYPSAIWSLLALAWVCGLIMHRLRWQRRLLGLTALVMVLWLIWPLLPLVRSPALRIDMLAVGDGSCYVLRSGGSTVLFDAGSSANLNAGRRSIVPAMRRLGVRSVEAIVISHPNFDHYSAVLEIVDDFNVGEVLVTPQFFEAAAADRFGPVAFLLDELTERSVSVSGVVQGDARTFGSSRWKWLHPTRQAQYARVNDGSMVIRIEAAGRHVLLCGDIQRKAMEILLNCDDDVDACILELPHHGSHHDLAAEFTQRVGAEVVMQSTGWTRWDRTKGAWEQPLGAGQRLVTARDGACWIEIDQDGTLQTGRFREPAEWATHDALP